MARINSKIDGTDVLGVVSAGETLYMARATHTHFGTVKPSIKDFVFDKDSAELLIRLGIGLKHTEDGIALAIYDGNYVTDIESTGDGLLIKYTDIDDGTTSEKTIPWTDLSEAQFEALKKYIANSVANHVLTELDFPNGDFDSVLYDATESGDGITLTGKAKIKYSDGTEANAEMALDIPLFPAEDNTINIDQGEHEKKIRIKATVGTGVDISIGLPAAAVEGTLTQEQFDTLQANKNNYIMLQQEKYYLNDDGHKEGFATYTHVGYESNAYWIKSITVNLNNKSWVLNSGRLDEDGLENVNAYTSTSEPDYDFTVAEDATLLQLLKAVINTKAKVARGTFNQATSRGVALKKLLGVPKGMTGNESVQIFLKVLSSDAYNNNQYKYETVVQVILHDNSLHALYEGYIHSWNANNAYWTGWTQITDTPQHPVPLYVGEQYNGADAYYSIISFDAHKSDLIFRANYSGKDIKLSELALKSEIPSGGSYYRHELVLASASTWEISIYVTVYSNTSIAADSLSDFYNLFNSGSNLISATGCGYKNGEYYNNYLVYAIRPTAMTSAGIYWAKFEFNAGDNRYGLTFPTLSWADSEVSWTVSDTVTNA